MSKIVECKALEAQIAEQLTQLDALKNSGELKRDIEFEETLRSLLATTTSPFAKSLPFSARQQVGRLP